MNTLSYSRSSATNTENKPKTGRTHSPQFIIEKRLHQISRRGGKPVGNQTLGQTHHNWRNPTSKEKGEEQSPYQTPQTWGWANKSLGKQVHITFGFKNQRASLHEVYNQ